MKKSTWLFALALALSLAIPALPIHHLEGHVLSPLLAARPPVYAPPLEDTVLLRPWRVRPLNGLRRLFGG